MVGLSPAAKKSDSLSVISPGMSISKKCICKEHVCSFKSSKCDSTIQIFQYMLHMLLKS